jgi:DNA-binding response OmpR family regulator
MPGLSGLDILPRIKKIQPQTPIVVMTAFGNEEIQRKVYERGGTVYLEKPIYFRELKRLTRKMVFPENKAKEGAEW